MTADAVGGVWTYALELAAALAEQGVNVALATMGAPPTPRQREEAEKIPNIQVFESGYKLEWMSEPWEDVNKAGRWLMELAEHLQPDVVHLNGYVHAALPWRAPTLVVGHSCCLSWYEAVYQQAVPEKQWDRYREEVTRGIQAANLVVAPSSAMLAALNRHYGSIVNGRVIPNARNPAVFHPTRKREFAIAAGRIWDEAKNISALTSIADKLLCPVYVAGETQHPDPENQANREWRSQAAAPNEGNGESIPNSQFPIPHPPRNVRKLGHLSQEVLADWFARAAIYVLPARYEPFGLSVLEAALSGCAMVLGDIPSLREIWGDAAVFVSPDDPEALAAAINALITGESRRRQLAKMARDRALEFTPQRMANSYLEAYQEVILHQNQ